MDHLVRFSTQLLQSCTCLYLLSLLFRVCARTKKLLKNYKECCQDPVKVKCGFTYSSDILAVGSLEFVAVDSSAQQKKLNIVF